MNSDAPRPILIHARKDYNHQNIDDIVRELHRVINGMLSPGVVRAQKLNISELPTSASGLRTGDIWSDSGTLKVV